MHMGLHPWSVETLLREALGISPVYGTNDVKDWNTFANIMNKLKVVSDESYSPVPEDWVFYELFRIAHQQFHWQMIPNARYVHRYIEMYRHPDLAQIIVKEFGFGYAPLLAFAISLYTYFRDDHALIHWPFPTHELGLSNEQALSIFERISCNLSAVSEHSRASRQLDVNFPYRQSIFREYPLIRHETTDGKLAFSCPIPRLLLYRLFDGLFFDLVAHPKFANSYGPAFESYAIDIARRVLPDRITILGEKKYGRKAERKDSVDIILSDETATVFVECKTRRVSTRAKIDLTTIEPINGEMDKLVLNVAKTYKNIRDGLDGHYSHWQPNSKPTYLIVLQLTNWFIFSEKLRQYIFSKLKVELEVLGVDPSILSEVPLIASSADDFEVLCSVLNDATIDSVLSKKTDDEHEGWELLSYLKKYYRDKVTRFVPKMATMGDAIRDLLPQDPSNG